MIQTDYSPDKFGTYLSHPESLGGGIDLSDSSVREIILAYRSYRRHCSRNTATASAKTFERYISSDED